MDEKRKTLRDIPAIRWLSLSIVAFSMMAAYFMTDVMSPLKPMLERELLWDSMDYGFFSSAYGWFNVFLLMLLFGGIILDRFGIRLTGKMATGMMVIGALIKYWAVSNVFDETQILGFKPSVFYAAVGYAIFGVGAEVAGITVTKTIVKWFKGKELALAMGLQLALARVGTILALAVSVPVAEYFSSVSISVLLGTVLVSIGFIAYFIYSYYDKRLDKQLDDNLSFEDEIFRWDDVKAIVSNRGFWLITFLCLLFYSSIFPFLKYASDLMVNKFGVDEDLAGIISGLLPFGTMILTPIFGNLYDRKGRGTDIMLAGAGIVLTVHALLAVPFLNSWWLAVFLMILLGIGFSMLPSALWPAVAVIVPEKQLGTAYGLIFYIQNIGLMTVPYLIGWILEHYCVEYTSGGLKLYNYTLPMILFSVLSIGALLTALLLKKENKIKNYGLELPNLKK
ncbi:MAG: MFS transporter [Bacteroidaceae bacterium]|nr:MFS transporter [Bacteroidaceae bacterium]